MWEIRADVEELIKQLDKLAEVFSEFGPARIIARRKGIEVLSAKGLLPPMKKIENTYVTRKEAEKYLLERK